MDATYWHRQTDTPLFPNIEWSRPERRDQAGKLLIIGGNSHGFSSVATAYQTSLSSGAGEVKLIMPSSLKNLPIIQTIPECIFVKANKTGALGLDAWDEIIGSLGWADWTLLPGDLGNNSETAQLILKLLKANRPISFSDSTTQLVINDIVNLTNQKNLILQCSFKTLQKLTLHLGLSTALTSTMPLAQFVERLHVITSVYHFTIITTFNGNIIAANNGQVSTTKTNIQNPSLSKISVYAMQHPGKIFEAVTTALYENK